MSVIVATTGHMRRGQWGRKATGVLRVQSCSNDKLYTGFLGGTMGTYDTGKCVAVRNGDCGKIKRGGRLRDLFRMRGTVWKEKFVVTSSSA